MVGTSGGLALFYFKDYPIKFLLLDDRIINVKTSINGNRIYDLHLWRPCCEKPRICAGKTYLYGDYEIGFMVH